MNTKILKALVIAAFLFPSICFSQQKPANNQVSIIPGEQQLIKEALCQSIVILRQDYVLKSTKPGSTKEFGLGESSSFGRAYGIGVRSMGKLWVNSELKKPWEADSNFVKYKKSDTVKPELSSLAMKYMNDKHFIIKSIFLTHSDSLKKTDTIITKNRKKTDSLKNINQKTLTFYDLKDSIKGVKMLRNVRDSIGWLVIAHTTNEFIKSDSLPVFMDIYKIILHYTDSTNEALIVDMPVVENILGGAFFTNHVKPGLIEFSFAGLLSKKEKNWIINTLQKAKVNSTKSNTKANPNAGNLKNNISPVNKTDKK